MSEEEFGWITKDKRMWSAEEDIRWCGNLAIGCGGFFILAGWVFIQYIEAAGIRCYVMTAAAIFGLLFCAIGLASHWWVYRKIKRTTIKRPEGWRP